MKNKIKENQEKIGRKLLEGLVEWWLMKYRIY
jgi:hypothetical protein